VENSASGSGAVSGHGNIRWSGSGEGCRKAGAERSVGVIKIGMSDERKFHHSHALHWSCSSPVEHVT